MRESANPKRSVPEHKRDSCRTQPWGGGSGEAGRGGGGAEEGSGAEAERGRVVGEERLGGGGGPLSLSHVDSAAKKRRKNRS